MVIEHSGAQMDRRGILKALTIAAAGAWPALAAGRSLNGTAINHVSYASKDYKKTRDFYRDLFGFQVADEDQKQLYGNNELGWVFTVGFIGITALPS
jgi:catechol-2,3-dioxygenase